MNQEREGDGWKEKRRKMKNEEGVLLSDRKKQ